ncbi:MAG: ankyrin repeat domain-containing protein [Oligoflexia bacterium]|nr:ankyrin repeat domain-containing protein [Oligoflexia bacterium]
MNHLKLKLKLNFNFFIYYLITICISTLVASTISYAGIFNKSNHTKLFMIISKSDDVTSFNSILSEMKKNELDLIINTIKMAPFSSWNKETLLTYAIKKNRSKIVNLLIQNDAYPLGRNDFGETALRLAILSCNKESIRSLLQKFNHLSINFVSKLTTNKKKESNTVSTHIIEIAYNKCGEEILDLFVKKALSWDIKELFSDKLTGKLKSATKVFITKLLQNKDLFSTAENYLDFLTRLSKSDLLSHDNSTPELINNNTINLFFNINPSPTVSEIISFSNTTKATNAQKAEIFKLAIKHNIIKNNEDFLKLLSENGDIYSTFSGANIELFFNFQARPTIEQAFTFAKDFETFNRKFDKEQEKEKILSFLLEKNITTDIDTIIPFIKLFTIKESRKLKIFQIILEKNLIKSPKDFLNLANAIVGNNDSKDLNFSESEINRFFNLIPVPTMEDTISLILLNDKSNHGTIFQYALNQNIIKNNSDFLTILSFSDSVRSSIKNNDIKRFFSSNTAPTVDQVMQLLTWISPSESSSAAIVKYIVDSALIQNIAKDADEIINSLSHYPRNVTNYSSSLVDWFLNLKPTPPIDKIIKFEALLKDDDQKFSLLNNLFNRKFINKPQDILNYISSTGLSRVIKEKELNNDLITWFLNSPNPKTTIKQVIDLVDLEKDPRKKIDIKRRAYNRYNLVNTPQDFIDLFASNTEIEDLAANETTLFPYIVEWFMNEAKPAPTAEQIAAFIKLAATAEQRRTIKDLSLKNDFIKTGQDFIKISSDANLKYKFTPKMMKFIEEKKLVFIGPDIQRLLDIFKESSHSQIKKIILANNKKANYTYFQDQVREEYPKCTDKNKLKYKYYLLSNDISNILEMTKLDATQKQQTFCQHCYDDKDTAGFYKCPNPKCNTSNANYACKESWKEFIDQQIAQHEFPLHCVNPECNEEIPITANDPRFEIKDKMGNIIDATFLAYFNDLHPDSECKNCITPDCINKIRKNKDCSSDGFYDCQFCGESYCYNCDDKPHKKMSCEEYKKEKLLKQKHNEEEEITQKLLHDPRSNIRPCAYCGSLTQKTEDKDVVGDGLKSQCNHIVCANKSCNKKWDWEIGRYEERTDVKYSKRDGSEPRKFRLKGEVNQKTKQVYSDYTVLNDPFEDLEEIGCNINLLSIESIKSENELNDPKKLLSHNLPALVLINDGGRIKIFSVIEEMQDLEQISTDGGITLHKYKRVRSVKDVNLPDNLLDKLSFDGNTHFFSNNECNTVTVNNGHSQYQYNHLYYNPSLGRN